MFFFYANEVHITQTDDVINKRYAQYKVNVLCCWLNMIIINRKHVRVLNVRPGTVFVPNLLYDLESGATKLRVYKIENKCHRKKTRGKQVLKTMLIQPLNIQKGNF